MNNDYNVESNSAWRNIGAVSFVTVVTPVYNRKDTILRAMQSVERQSYKDMEYIVVNDGSTDSTEEIIIDFLHKTTVPMLYVKKDNGGVHTARNLGIKLARGEMYMCNDSDDESFPNAVEIFVNAWKTIPKEQRNLYFEIKARCINEVGEEVGPRFPEDINNREWIEIKQYYESIHAENVGFRRMDIMKANPWPEPENVTFVGEDFVWKKLRMQYRTWLINDIVQVYHTEGNDHLEGNLNAIKRRSSQTCRNAYWKSSYVLNNYDLFGVGHRFKYFLSRTMMWHVLGLLKKKRNYIALDSMCNTIEDILISPCGFILGKLYIKKYNLRDEQNELI